MRFPKRILFTAFFCFLSIAALVACSAILGDFDVVPGSANPDGGPVSDTGTTPPTDGPTSNPDTGTGTPDSGGTVDGGGDGGDSGPKTYCDTVIFPVGTVQSACNDFDEPLSAKDFDAIQDDGGTLLRTGLNVSPPNGIEATITGGPADLNYVWKRTGAKNFEEVVARLEINPGTVGGVLLGTNTLLELVDIRTTNAAVTFGYARGATNLGGVAYTGYYVITSTFGGAAALTQTKMPVQITANTWTNLKIVWDKNGNLEIFYAGVSIIKPIAYASADTQVTMRIGPHVINSAGNPWPAFRFDNIELSIRRQ